MPLDDTMNKAELLEAEKRRHEFDMMDRRMGEQRIIDEICEQQIKPLSARVSVLEIWGATITGGFAVAVAWLRKERII